MKKQLALIIAVLTALAFQVNAQITVDPEPDGSCVDEHYHPHGFPPGPIGSYNNPIYVYANLGEWVTMGDYGVSPHSPWYYVTGWWTQPQVPGAVEMHPYLEVWGWHIGQTLSKWTDANDYRNGVIYAVADPGHGYVFEFFEILHRPNPNCVNGTR